MSAKEHGGVLVLSRRDVAGLLNLPTCIDAVEAAFVAAADGQAVAPPAASLPVPGGAFHAKGAALLAPGRAVVAIKLNGNFPGNPASNGLPTVQGVIYLASAEDGRPLALMDSIEITISRTCAATMLALRHLARTDASVATICGAGVQGRIHLKALTDLAALDRINLFDTRPGAADALASIFGGQSRPEIRAVGSLAEVRNSDIVVTCTSARQAYLTPELIRPGTFIAAVGADNPDKQEIDPKLFGKARVVVDSLEQCAEIGDLRHALRAGTIAREGVHATLAEIVSGRKPGRCNDEEITLFDSSGLGLQDVAAAEAVYRRALACGAGTRLTIN